MSGAAPDHPGHHLHRYAPRVYRTYALVWYPRGQALYREGESRTMPVIGAPRGSRLQCKGWQQVAALRLLMNDLARYEEADTFPHAARARIRMALRG